MTFIIRRLVGQENLLKRPRVSSKVSEYVFGYLNDKLLIPLNIMQSNKYVYDLTLSFNFRLPKANTILYKSPFSTAKRIFIPQKGFRIFEKTNKTAHLTVLAEDIDENTTPKEFALLIYDMFADFLLYNFKKISKEEIDQLKAKIDFSKIEKYKFPAPFSEQDYILDKGKYMVEWNDFLNKREDKWIIVKDEYLKHYGF
jgi:hypothetical protein